MKLNNKAQGAMEYLMTYGWAILVVMVVGIVMWQLGVFNLGGSMTPTFSGFGAIKPQLAAASYTAAGTFESIFTNGAGTTISITGLFINETKSATECTGPYQLDGVLFVSPVSIAPGANFIVSNSLCGTASIGEAYTVAVALEHDLTIGSSTVSKSSAGTIRGPVE